MRVTVQEIVRILRQDLGAVRGAAYARRIATAGGLYAQEYERAAEILEREQQPMIGGTDHVVE
jgi:hypothetical protein